MGDAAELRYSWGWGVPSYREYGIEDEPSRREAPVFVPPSPSRAGRVHQSPSLAGRRHSMSAMHYPDTPKQGPSQSPSFVSKALRVKDRISRAREECIELRQEASDLQEYSNAKIERVTRYLGVLAEKARRLDDVALESESRVIPLKKEKKKLFNDLVSAKGNIRVYCRARPQFEDEDSSFISYPDDFTLRINSNVSTAPSKDFELDRIYGPHISQGDIFQDLQPLVQSALDGYNVSIFAYGQAGSGKSYTMEGPSHDRGLYYRAFEELFDLVNAENSPSSRTAYYVTMFELHNEQVRDLLKTSDSSGASTVMMGGLGHGVELVDERIDSPSGFTRVFKFGSQMRANVDGVKSDRSNRSHLVVTIHIYTTDSLTGEEQYSKLSMVDLASSERFSKAEVNGDRLTESLHINKSLSALGDVFAALSAKKDYIPYGHSKLTQLLADSLGGDSKAVLIANVSPSNSDLQETIATLNFVSRARNAEISLGNRDTIKKWRDVASEARRELYEKEKEATEAQGEVMQLKRALKEADAQCLLLFDEVQKAWKLASSLQADLTSHESYINKLQVENHRLSEQKSRDQDQYAVVMTQLSMFTMREEQYQSQLKERGARIEALEVRVQVLEQQLHEARSAAASTLPAGQDNLAEIQMLREETENAVSINQKLEEELTKRDELIERLHQENEKLFERLTERTSTLGSPKISVSPKIPHLEQRAVDDFNLDGSTYSTAPASPDMRSSSVMKSSSVGQPSSPRGAVELLKYGSDEQLKSTPAGEYLTAALMDFNPDHYESDAAIADGANKLLMLVLAAVVKAGASREHEMLAEIQGAVFTFIRNLENRTAMDTMLVSRVRILYIRSLLSRAPELQSLKVPLVERFLEKAGSGFISGRSSRNSSLGSSPQRSPNHSIKDGYDYLHGFRVNLRQEKRSKFSSMFSKLRGNDQDSSRQHVSERKLKETSEDARAFAIGNKSLASLFVHTPAGELRRQIRGWLAENFDFLSLTGGETISGVSSHLELLSTAILDGWMSGLGVPQYPSTDALGQLLSDYTKMVYNRQLQQLQDVGAALAAEVAEDEDQVTKLRSELESVELKRRKVLTQMRTNITILTEEDGASPARNPPMDAMNARVASLTSLEDMYKQAGEMRKDAPEGRSTANKKLSYLKHLDALEERMSTLLSIDYPCAQRCITDARRFVELLEVHQEVPGVRHTRSRTLDGVNRSADFVHLDERMNNRVESEVIQWSVLQFNNGSATPFVIKCGATSNLELVVKAQAKMQEKTGKEIVAVVPVPSALAGLSLEGIAQTISHLPESFYQLAMARTADGTRARYTRLYKTLAIRVPSLKHVLEESEESALR
ncbi:kinesin-like protein KIN-14A isoform X3 [Physcomitrium patens]|uniref:Kinesin-like protein for chloroplast movement 1 n=1 Tax=Physcomitrium patens TaxID=3218 RepID=K0J1Z0_PHYPA|nr:kinesin-like protein KIN-14A isoform X3 [Physcomitrium patens]PNR57261.1 hypothetical protein PHYPA_004255 [Physcomitrium patens]BAM48920.1 kinesin-like protein for chloroplast movement 1 [Physcomitrium patens]|eukprot:XP_024370737.1 kinesin-like protein KIN-14A isoform X3 [Physcomitrella patens]